MNILKTNKIIEKTESKNEKIEFEIAFLYESSRAKKSNIQVVFDVIKEKGPTLSKQEICFYSDLELKQVTACLGSLKKSGSIRYETPEPCSVTTIKSISLDGIDWDYYERKRERDIQEFQDLADFLDDCESEEERHAFIRGYFAKCNLDSARKEIDSSEDEIPF